LVSTWGEKVQRGQKRDRAVELGVNRQKEGIKKQTRNKQNLHFKEVREKKFEGGGGQGKKKCKTTVKKRKRVRFKKPQAGIRKKRKIKGHKKFKKPVPTKGNRQSRGHLQDPERRGRRSQERRELFRQRTQ